MNIYFPKKHLEGIMKKAHNNNNSLIKSADGTFMYHLEVYLVPAEIPDIVVAILDHAGPGNK